jgi:hypothetical protein
MLSVMVLQLYIIILIYFIRRLVSTYKRVGIKVNACSEFQQDFVPYLPKQWFYNVNHIACMYTYILTYTQGSTSVT